MYMCFTLIIVLVPFTLNPMNAMHAVDKHTSWCDMQDLGLSSMSPCYRN
jgi:hypothetical protein